MKWIGSCYGDKVLHSSKIVNKFFFTDDKEWDRNIFKSRKIQFNQTITGGHVSYLHNPSRKFMFLTIYNKKISKYRGWVHLKEYCEENDKWTTPRWNLQMLTTKYDPWQTNIHVKVDPRGVLTLLVTPTHTYFYTFRYFFCSYSVQVSWYFDSCLLWYCRWLKRNKQGQCFAMNFFINNTFLSTNDFQFPSTKIRFNNSFIIMNRI